LYYTGERTTAHVVLRSGDERPARFVLANPAGDTGIGFWAQKMAPTNGLRAEGALQPTTSNGLSGVQVSLSGPSKVRIDRIFLDSVRTLRDADHDGEGARIHVVNDAYRALSNWGKQNDPRTEELRQTALTRLRQWFEPQRVMDPRRPEAIILERRALGSGARYRVEFVPREGTTASGDGVHVTLSSNGRTRFDVRSFIDRPALSPMGMPLVDGREGRMGEALRFLSTKEKILAGSWQYLTYFGRDTLISGALLANRGSKPFLGTAIGSVLDRIGPRGEVAHEEAVGDQAALMRVADLTRRIGTEGAQAKLTEADFSSLERPIYDYKMVDGEYLLPQLIARFVGRLDANSPADQKLARETFSDQRLRALARELVRIDEQTSAPAAGRAGGLIALRPGMDAGNWRDSEGGLGGGRYPLDVNAYLVPSALRSLATVVRDPRFPKQALLEQAGANRSRLTAMLDPRNLAARAEGWRRAASSSFEVKLSAAEARGRVSSYLQKLPAEDQRALSSQRLFGSDSTLAQALSGQSNVLGSGVRFHALALDGDKRPIPILSSDGAFDFFYGAPTRDEVLSQVNLLFQPFPLGLATPVGIVAANAAYSTRPGDAATFSPGKYHGAVVWGWQQQMLRAGIEKQLEIFKGDAVVERTLRKALDGMTLAEKNAGAFAGTAELWSWKTVDGKAVAVPYGTKKDATESNDRQLWSVAGGLGR
jgi:hypothetical protein